ncbi:GNAT family N-acetyltransferase [Floricoccus tropicus]|uniref:GNAT family N-acetyltransferase n=1 Tax=Floricoccus tropicus TaxID=1859473 RepID=A0A1E8GKB9_9LACT|nr:GNAT family N-acetyltransferase [Floricoccus tropicus]OFI48700.1 GNAT family N-acetyltransferase [Floricoccus tropicus]
MDILVKLAEYNVIETERLLLRPIQISDANDMFKYSSDEENLIYIFPPHRTIEETKYSITHNFMAKPLGKWAIEFKENSKMIGTIDFIKVNFNDKNVEIGYVLNKVYWGMGFMTEAIRTLTDFSFREFGLKSLEIIVDKRNIASSRVAENVGFKKIRDYKSANKYTKEIVIFTQYKIERWEYLKENE